MTECKQEVFEFQVHGSRKVTGDFTGGDLSSDGGAVFLRGVDLKMGLMERLAGCFCDYRLPCLVEHQVSELLRQRIGALPLGYEDLNDHDRLRLDPLHALLAGKADVLGEDRLWEGDKGKALAAHSTLNRLEHGALGGDTRYKKIIAKPPEIEALLIEEGVKAIPRKSREIILDFDATDDPLHGNQQGAFFHGYYRHYCYLPLYCFCGNVPLVAQLREAKSAMPAAAQWRRSRKSLVPFGSALGARCALLCGPTVGSLARRLWRGASKTGSITVWDWRATSG